MGAAVGPSDGKGQDFEINLAPIIDCFVVLITYLLVTASFLTMMAVDVGVSASGQGEPITPAGPPPMFMVLEMKASRQIVIRVSGGTLASELVLEIDTENPGQWNYRKINSKLAEVQARWPDIKDVSVSAEANVQYKEIVTLINEIKKVVPKVYISG